MPVVNTELNIQAVPLDTLKNYTKEIFNQMGAKEVNELVNSEGNVEIKALIPSIWGWGGMIVGVELIQKAGSIELILYGYIAQLAVRPLTKKMDEFAFLLQKTLKDRHGITLEYEKLTRFIPKYKLNITAIDKKVFLSIVSSIFIGFLLEALGYIDIFYFYIIVFFWLYINQVYIKR